MRKPRRKGVSEYHFTVPEDMTTEMFLVSVQYCSRCGAEYPAHQATLYLTVDEELGEDEDGERLAVCRNRLACDGNLIEHAAEFVDMARYEMVSEKPLGKLTYEYLTEAFDALAKVYPGLEVEAPRCGKCFGPLPEGAEDETLCRFCREEAKSDK